MTIPFEPNDVDFVIGGIESDPEAVAETERLIAERKRRPEHRAEMEEAERTLARLGIELGERGRQRAEALYEHWLRVRAELEAEDGAKTNGVGDHAGPGAEVPVDRR